MWKIASELMFTCANSLCVTSASSNCTDTKANTTALKFPAEVNNFVTGSSRLQHEGADRPSHARYTNRPLGACGKFVPSGELQLYRYHSGHSRFEDLCRCHPGGRLLSRAVIRGCRPAIVAGAKSSTSGDRQMHMKCV